MATLTLTNVPSEVVARLQDRAERHGRSLDEEAIECLRRGLEGARADVDATLENARNLRAGVGGWLTDRALERARSTGRP